MAASSFVVDTIVAEQTQGTMLPEAPATLGRSDVEAIMKEDDVSNLGLDSQDWEMVSEMVADTENAVTDFMQGSHVVLEEPQVDLQTSLQAMEETMANLNLGAAASGVNGWFSEGRWSLSPTPSRRSLVPKEIKLLVDPTPNPQIHPNSLNPQKSAKIPEISRSKPQSATEVQQKCNRSALLPTFANPF